MIALLPGRSTWEKRGVGCGASWGDGLFHRVCEMQTILLIWPMAGHGGAFGRNSRQEGDRAPRCRVSHATGILRRLNADKHHMIKRDSCDICRGAKTNGYSCHPPLWPFAFAPEEQGSLEGREGPRRR
jgi:hypothetical protein